MAEFDWVTERANCSIAAVFAKFQTGVANDASTWNTLPDSASRKIDIVEAAPVFKAVRRGVPSAGLWYVQFTCDAAAIRIRSNDDAIRIDATLTLNNAGECRLKVGANQELELWQVRRMALEQLFFGA